jgi:hypothetical protein
MTLTYRDFIRGDPVAALLVAKSKWAPFWIGLAAWLAALASSLVIAIAGGRFLPNPSYYKGLSVDGYYWLAEFFVGVAWGYYIWMCKAPLGVLKQLQKSGSITLNPRRQKALSKISKRRWMFWLALVFAVATCPLAFFQMKWSGPRWLNINYIAMASRLGLVVLPTSFAAWSFAFRVVTNTRIFAFAFHRLILHPLHPDRLCGLRPLGKYALTSTYPIVLIGIVGYLGYWQFRHVSGGTAALVYAAIGIYVVLLPAIFGAPVWFAHKAMLRAKNKLMRPISEEFDKAFSLTLGNVRDSAKTLENHLQRTNRLQKVHAIAKQVPEWPVDFQIVRPFLISLSPSALGIIIPLVMYLLAR